ncbi:hypothetical protein BT63DRAFT_426217 [Microthyrium microscopicum]|uniref:Uncharacterized protein n=1 Tax=Microthyrium microscopicum TaxID=703497 RepID=A0A6A6U8V4_9PEZI|nr:hypothetical protein BT63DRAFT_426217 [Microthyrium microscopicum]
MAKQKPHQKKTYPYVLLKYVALLLSPLIFGIAIIYFQKYLTYNHDPSNDISARISRNRTDRGWRRSAIRKEVAVGRFETVLSPLPTKRSTIFKYDARVACWPSTGGIWIKHASPVELDFLKVSRRNDTEKPSERTYYWARPGNGDPDIYVPPPIQEEDFFCLKLRMLGADFWDLPLHEELHDQPIEYTISPRYKNHLGIYWSTDNHALPSMVNLTEAFLKYGPGLKGYNIVESYAERENILQELGGIHCARQPQTCSSMWCSQYPDNCDEKILLEDYNHEAGRWSRYLSGKEFLYINTSPVTS